VSWSQQERRADGARKLRKAVLPAADWNAGFVPQQGDKPKEMLDGGGQAGNSSCRGRMRAAERAHI